MVSSSISKSVEDFIIFDEGEDGKKPLNLFSMEPTFQ